MSDDSCGPDKSNRGKLRLVEDWDGRLARDSRIFNFISFF